MLHPKTAYVALCQCWPPPTLGVPENQKLGVLNKAPSVLRALGITLKGMVWIRMGAQNQNKRIEES